MSKAFENWMDEYRQKQGFSSISTETMMLAQSAMLLNRALAHVGLSDLDCAVKLSVEIRDHLDVLKTHAFNKGIAFEYAEALQYLLASDNAAGASA